MSAGLLMPRPRAASNDNSLLHDTGPFASILMQGLKTALLIVPAESSNECVLLPMLQDMAPCVSLQIPKLKAALIAHSLGVTRHHTVCPLELTA